MSLREVQTAAARIIHIERVNDSAIDELKSRFGYHPLDLEGLFSAPVEPSFSQYGQYALLTLLWPDAKFQETSELRFFVDGRHLTVIGDTADHEIHNFIAAVERGLASKESQLSAPELIQTIISRLRQPWTGGPMPARTDVASRFSGNASVIRQLARWLQTQNLVAAVPTLIIEAYQLDLIVDRLHVTSPTRILTPLKQYSPWPRLLGTYAVASAVMVILVIVTLSIQ